MHALPERTEQLVDRIADCPEIGHIAYAQSRIVHVNGVRFGVVAESVLHASVEHSFPETHWQSAKHLRIPLAWTVDRRTERKPLQDIAIEIYAGRHLHQREPCRFEPENAALRYIDHLLLGGLRVRSAEGDLPDPLDELRGLAFPDDAESPVVQCDLEPARGEGAHEHHLLGVLTDIDESTTPWNTGAELASVHVSVAV